MYIQCAESIFSGTGRLGCIVILLNQPITHVSSRHPLAIFPALG